MARVGSRYWSWPLSILTSGAWQLLQAGFDMKGSWKVLLYRSSMWVRGKLALVGRKLYRLSRTVRNETCQISYRWTDRFGIRNDLSISAISNMAARFTLETSVCIRSELKKKFSYSRTSSRYFPRVWSIEPLRISQTQRKENCLSSCK